MEKNDFINTTDIIIYTAATIEIDSRWKYYDLKSPFNRLYYIIDGSSYIIHSGKKYKLEPGYMYLMSADSSYSYICNNYAKKHYVHFNLQSKFGFDVLSMDRSPIKYKISPNRIFELSKYKKDNSYMASLKYKGIILKDIAKFLKGQDDRIQKRFEELTGYGDILKYIHDNLNFELKTKDIANKFSLSNSTLDRKFKKMFSTSVKGYIEKSILDKAIKHILTSDSSIKEIAFELGFNDPLYFSKFVKRKTGYSPKKYKKNHI